MRYPVKLRFAVWVYYKMDERIGEGILMVRNNQLFTLYQDVSSTAVHWLWYPYIAIGKITIVQGDPGDGKSTMLMNLIAKLSVGGILPYGTRI